MAGSLYVKPKMNISHYSEIYRIPNMFSTQMVPSYVYGIVTILIIVVLVVVVVYLTMKEKAEALVIEYSDGALGSMAQHPTLQLFHTHFSEAPLGAQKLSKRDALVMYGEVPRGYAYWGITGYLYDFPSHDDPMLGNILHASIGDTVSSQTVATLSPGDGVAVVLTTNPLLFREVKQQLQADWVKIHRRHPLRVLPIYIPTDLYFEQARYALQLRVVLRRHDQLLPRFACRLYTSHNIVERSVKSIQFRPRTGTPKEQDSVSEEVWYQSAIKALAQKNYTILREVAVQRPLQHILPLGLDMGAMQAISIDNGVYVDTPASAQNESRRTAFRHSGNYTNCQGDSRDITMFETGDIAIGPDESIAVVAVDHAMSRRSIYSALHFNHVEGCYAMYVTGDAIHRTYNLNSTIKAQLTVNTPPAGVTSVRVNELIYPDSDIGPSYDSVLSMKVFVIKRVEDPSEGEAQ